MDMQEKMCKEYAERENIEVLKVFIDRGESAKTADRTEFTKAISVCTSKKYKVNYFIIYKVDRFSRSNQDYAVIASKLRQYGTELRSATEPINETSFGKFMAGILSVSAEFDNNVRSERSKGGMMEQVKKGVWVWGAPVGYYKPFRGSKGSNIAPDPEKAHYIRLMFEEYAKGGYSYNSLAKFLAGRGFRTKNGKKPFPQLIERCIKNPIYYGLIDIWGLQVKGAFEPIISEELFFKCQNEYKGKNHVFHRTAFNPNFPLRRTKCLKCLGSLTGSFSKGNNGTRYPFYHHHKQECPNAKFIPKATFEQVFIEYLNEITPTKKYEKLFKGIMLDIWQSNYKKFDETNGIVRKEIELLEKDRQSIFDKNRAGIYSDDEFLEQKERLNQQIREKTQLLQENRIEEFDMDEALTYCFNFVGDTAKTWLRLKYENKLRFQNLIAPENFNFDGNKFGTNKLSSIYAINKEYDGKKSHLVRPPRIELGTFSLKGSCSAN